MTVYSITQDRPAVEATGANQVQTKTKRSRTKLFETSPSQNTTMDRAKETTTSPLVLVREK